MALSGMNCRKHGKGWGTRPVINDGAGPGGGRGGREVGRLWVHLKAKLTQFAPQIRCGRGWRVAAEASCSEVSQEQEGQEGYGSETADHSSGQKPTGSSWALQLSP